MTTGFEDSVVLKPWGHEFQVFDNGRVSIWMLCIKPGQGTSVHCHFGKTARFVPIVGTAMVRTNSEIFQMSFPESVAVDRYEFHAVGNIGPDDLWLIEIESPSDKNDLFRLRDGYGRGQGYERGGSIQRVRLGDFGHFNLIPEGNWVERDGFRVMIRAGALHVETNFFRCHHSIGEAGAQAA